MQTIRWGIIGCGAVTEKKSGPAFSLVPHSKLFGVMRRDEEKLRDYATRHQVEYFTTDAKALIQHPDIDAIYIATPPHLHLAYALKVAAAGKPCCVEKPMALNTAQCQQMIAAFAQKQLPLFVAYYRRSLPRFQRIKTLIEQGRIGKPRHLQWEFCRLPRPDVDQSEQNWRVNPALAGGGYFVDLASHGLDLFHYFFGTVDQAFGVSSRQQKLYAAEDAVSACWRYQSGLTASGFWNFVSADRRDRVTLFGSKGRITFSMFDEQPICVSDAHGEEQISIAHPDNIQYYHIDNMNRHLRGELQHPSLGQDAIQATRLMEAILGSAQ